MLQMNENLTESPIEEVLDAIHNGLPVILMDDIDRENEADLIIAAEKLTTESMTTLINDCSGIVCLCLDSKIADRLDLPLMVEQNSSRYQTAFTVSIEAKNGVTTGVSAADRTKTVLTAIEETAGPEHLARPGHIFPLRAHDMRIQGRRGHTEGAVFLMELAGFKPAAVLCELMNKDGSMMRGEALFSYGKIHQLPVISIKTLSTIELN